MIGFHYSCIVLRVRYLAEFSHYLAVNDFRMFLCVAIDSSALFQLGLDADEVSQHRRCGPTTQASSPIFVLFDLYIIEV